jgi:hypothetical protein
MGSTELDRLGSHAYNSLKERFITRILEREDVGYIRWTPRAIYDQIAKDHPHLYPEDPPAGMLAQFMSDEFTEELAKYRQHRRMSQLPSRMLADTIGRRIIDLAYPLIESKLHSLSVDGGILDFREIRMILKDAIAFTNANEDAMTGKDPRKKEQEGEKQTGLSFDDAIKLMARATGDRREVMAKVLAQELMAMANQANAETIEGEVTE